MPKYLSAVISSGFFGFGAWAAATRFDTIAGKGFAAFSVLFIWALLATWKPEE